MKVKKAIVNFTGKIFDLKDNIFIAEIKNGDFVWNCYIQEFIIGRNVKFIEDNIIYI